MKLDEYQIQKSNSISDNLFAYSDRIAWLRKNAEFIDEKHYASEVSNILDHLADLVKDVKELEKYSWEKEAEAHHDIY